MERKIVRPFLIVFFVCFSTASVAQGQGISYAKISNSYSIKTFDVKAVKSMLFILKGEERVQNSFYPDLASQLESLWKRRLKKNWKKDVKIGFRYELKYRPGKKKSSKVPRPSKNPEIIPDLICKLSVYNFREKKIGDVLSEESFSMNVELIDPETNDLMQFGELNVVSRRDFKRTNKAIVKLIDKIIKQQK